MENKERPINIDTAREMIRRHNGVLMTNLSILHAIEVYDLDNSTIICIKVYRKEATLYLNRADAVGHFRNMRPMGSFNSCQDELTSFPDNKDSILLALSKELGFVVDAKNLDLEYNDRLSQAIEKYSLPKAKERLFLGLVVLLGETIIYKYGGSWEIEIDGFLGDRQPLIRLENGQKEAFFIKMLGDELERGLPFYWTVLASFRI